MVSVSALVELGWRFEIWAAQADNTVRVRSERERDFIGFLRPEWAEKIKP
jgi:hypothetical protein